MTSVKHLQRLWRAAFRVGVLSAAASAWSLGCASGSDEGGAGAGAAGDGWVAGSGVAGDSAGSGQAGIVSAGVGAAGSGTAGTGTAGTGTAGVGTAGTGTAGTGTAGTGTAGTGTAGTGTAGTGTAGTGTAGTGAAGTGGPGVCGGDTPHGCYTPVSTNTEECPEQIPEQTEGPVVPLPEWVSCGTPANVCKYNKPAGGEANCFCDTGVHWICTYGP